MRNKKIYIVTTFIIATALALTSYFLIKDRQQEDSTYSYNDLVGITLERDVCFGFCPSYILTIDKDGKAAFNGRSFVREENKRIEFEVSEDKVKDILNEFEEIDFFEFEDAYVESVTDLPSTTITLKLEDREKSIYLYGIDLPKELTDLSDKIDEISGASEYKEYSREEINNIEE